MLYALDDQLDRWLPERTPETRKILLLEDFRNSLIRQIKRAGLFRVNERKLNVFLIAGLAPNPHGIAEYPYWRALGQYGSFFQDDHTVLDVTRNLHASILASTPALVNVRK